jgi:hypothetical protein
MARSITVAVTRQLTLTTLLLVVGCSGCSSAIRSSDQSSFTTAVVRDFGSQQQTAFTPAVLRDSLPDGKYAVTVCASNNVPYVVVEIRLDYGIKFEGSLVHELKHVYDMVTYKGGCWAFLYRYRDDPAFRFRVEFAAYCAAGQWMLTRNRDPRAVWDEIARTMREQFNVTPTENCIYEETR